MSVPPLLSGFWPLSNHIFMPTIAANVPPRVTVTNMFRNTSQSVSGTGIFSLRHIMLNLPH